MAPDPASLGLVFWLHCLACGAGTEPCQTQLPPRPRSGVKELQPAQGRSLRHLPPPQEQMEPWISNTKQRRRHFPASCGSQPCSQKDRKEPGLQDGSTKAGLRTRRESTLAERDHFLLAPSLKRDCNRAGEVKSIWTQLTDIFQQSQAHSAWLCWCKLHDSESPGRQPWARETRGTETLSASDLASPLTQTLRQKPRSRQPLPGLWSLCAERGNNQQLQHRTPSLPLGVIPFPGSIKSTLSAAEPDTIGSRTSAAAGPATTRTNLHISLRCHGLAKREGDLLSPGDVSCHKLKNLPLLSLIYQTQTQPLPATSALLLSHTQKSASTRRAQECRKLCIQQQRMDPRSCWGSEPSVGAAQGARGGHAQAGEPTAALPAPGPATGQPESSSATRDLTTPQPPPSPAPAGEQPAGTPARAPAAASPQARSPPARPHSPVLCATPRSRR